MRIARWFLAAAGAALMAGCQSGPQFVEVAPIVPHGVAYVDDQNPVFIPLGPTSYGLVFENCLQVLGDYGFELREQNRYSGHIETIPRVSPGLLLFLKPGSPDYYANVTQRELAVELADYLAKRLDQVRPEEATAARVLRELVKHQRLG